MIENYKVITSNHLLAEVSNLGTFIIAPDNTSKTLEQIKDILAIDELLYLVTCNRVMYLMHTDVDIDEEFLYEFFKITKPEKSKIEILALFSNIAVYEGLEAVQHVLEVAGSIDSLVVGESEIFRQFREAYTICHSNKLLGDKIRLLDKKVVQTVKSIHTHTRIGEKPLSIASLAMSVLLTELENHENNIAVIGAGETNKLVCKLLKPKSIGHYTIFNRTLAKAKSLAKFMDGKANELEQLNDSNNDFDIFIVTTSSQVPILTDTIFLKNASDLNKKRIIIDLSVPRNVDLEISQRPNVKYICIDDLKVLANLNLEYRKNEIVLAREIISKALHQFPKEYQEREIEVALSDVPHEINKIKKKALNDVYKKRIDTLSQDAQQLIYEIMDYMEQKCISAPIKAAKRKIL